MHTEGRRSPIPIFWDVPILRNVLRGGVPAGPPRPEGVPKLHHDVLRSVMNSQGVRARNGDVGHRAATRAEPNLGTLRYQGIAFALPMGPALLATHAPKRMFVRTTLARGNLAGLVGINGVPQLSVGGSNRRQTHLLERSQGGGGLAR